MTNEEAIAIIRKEYLCVDRDCDIERSCGKCDLMMPSKEPILKAFKMAMQALETIPKYKDAYNKGWDDGAKATYEHLKMCEEEQGGDLISRYAVIDIIHRFFTEEVDKIPTKKTEDGEVIIICKAQPLFAMNKTLSRRIKELSPVNPQEPSITWVTGADGAKIAFKDVPAWKVIKICQILDDVVEVEDQEPTGHWEWLTEDKYRCSNCNSETRVDECLNEPMYEFCPFCGARMESEE